MNVTSALSILVATVINAAASGEVPANNATLLFAGDAMQHKGQLATARQADGTYSYAEYYKTLTPFISEADYAIVNLETPLPGSDYTGYPCFGAPDSYAEALRDAGFDLFLTANNHCLDKSDRGLRRTVDVLDQLGVRHVGTYRNKADRDTIAPAIVNVRGFQIAFLNYTYGTNGIKVKGDVVVDYIDKEKIKTDIKKARENGAELVCVSMHWGDEYHLLPNETQKSLAKFLLDQGVEIINGGHPHVIQPMEMRTNSNGDKSLLIYSTGNFVSDMRKTDCRGGAMVKTYISRDENGKARVDSAGYKLVFVEPGVAGRRNHTIVDADSCQLTEVKGACREFMRSATNIFDKHNVDVPKLK